MTAALTALQADQLRRAHGLMQAGQLAQAEQLIAPVLRALPRQPDTLHLMGLVKQRAGKPHEAVMLLRQALSAVPGHGHILNSLANALGDAGDIDGALAAYADLTHRMPNHLEAWLNWGITALSAKRPSAAIPPLRKASTLAPRDARIWRLLGEANVALGDSIAARATFTTALTLAPHDAELRGTLAAVLRDDDLPADALALIALAPAPDAALELEAALALADQGAFDAALARFDALCEAEPAHARAQSERAKLLWKTGQVHSPGAAFAAALDKHGAVLPLWHIAIRTCFEGHAHGEALDLIARAQAKHGASALLTEARAFALSELGEVGAAQSLFDSVPLTSPEQLSTYARHLLRAGDAAGAARACEQALAQAPDLQIAQSYLSLAWRLLGDPREQWLHDYAQHVQPVLLEPSPPFATLAEQVEAVAALLTRLHITVRQPLEQTLRGGTQTLGQILNRPEPELKAMRASIQHAMRRAIAALPDDPTHPFLRRKPAAGAGLRFTGSWSVRLASQGYHVNHMHSEGWISSACYLALPPVLDQNEQGWIQFGAPPVEMGLDLPARRRVRPELGLLVLFPSSMWHGTVPFTSAAPRMTIAFDAMPVG
jgi:tetratricopeptide (TPR) repeat protein